MAKRPSSIPITVVTGFKGVGKSTLIEHVQKSIKDRKLGILQDDGEVNLFDEIENSIDQGVTGLFIECTANLEPYFVAEHLVEGDDSGPPPAGIHVDTLVTVIDATSVLRYLTESIELNELDLSFDEEDDRLVSELLIEQIEFADVIVINKIDRVSIDRTNQLEALFARLNPRARILRAEQGRVSPRDVFETGSFDLVETDDGAGWLAELSGDFPDNDGGHGVSSFTFMERRPFHPIRFNELLADLQLKGVVRAKGYVWVASRHHEIGVWSLAGHATLLTYGGAWFAATPAREWPKDGNERMEIMKEWVPPFGDRRQEIAFIGVDMHEAEIRERLKECLLTSSEMKNGPDGWFALPDPLPDWHVDTDPESYGEDWS